MSTVPGAAQASPWIGVQCACRAHSPRLFRVSQRTPLPLLRSRCRADRSLGPLRRRVSLPREAAPSAKTLRHPCCHHTAKNEAKPRSGWGGGHLTRTGGAGEYWCTTTNSSTKVPQMSNKNPHHCLRSWPPTGILSLHLSMFCCFQKILTPTPSSTLGC